MSPCLLPGTRGYSWGADLVGPGMGCGGEAEEEEVLGEEEELINLTPVTRAGPGLVRLLSGTETHMTRAEDGGSELFTSESTL